MNTVILIRYSEIFLKGANRKYFENALYNNIKQSLSSEEYKLEKYSGRYIVRDFESDKINWFIEQISNVFGVHSLSAAYEVTSNIDDIAEAAILCAKGKGTFRITTNRADKTFPLKSFQVSAEIGGRVLNKYNEMRVDLHNAEQEIFLDMRENGKTLIFGKVIKAVNGMPIGVSGNGLLLLSGGIDSPVACFMMAKRGMSIRALHFASYPYTSEAAKQKVLSLAKILKKYCLNLTVDIVSFTEIQTQIHQKCPENLLIAIMRRFMMRIANILAEKNNCGAIITGESLGQVASQTLESITCTNDVTQLPIFRPLIGFDKEDIIEVARKIGTFQTSILPYEDCCTIFLPKNPVTKPKVEYVSRAEEALDTETLIYNALQNIETVII